MHKPRLGVFSGAPLRRIGEHDEVARSAGGLEGTFFCRRAGIGRGVARWQALCFAAGWLSLGLAVVSPLRELGEHLFMAHMIEHELLMAVAAPLLALSRPLGTFLHGLPRRWRVALVAVAGGVLFSAARQRLMMPIAATSLRGVTVWAWHVPALLDATLENEGLHRLQHTSFLGTALIFWWALLRRPRRDYGQGALHVFTTMLHTSLLGALLTLAPRVLYPTQMAQSAWFGLTPLEDQQLAGLIMWIPGGSLYPVAGLALAGLCLTVAPEKRMPRPGSGEPSQATAAIM